jgi:uncharacterized protein YgiM (DUF1202 family)
VVADALNVRESADPTSQIVGQLNVGMVIEIDGSVSEGWVPVTFDSGQASVQGFVSADHVETIPVSGQERLRRVVESWLP